MLGTHVGRRAEELLKLSEHGLVGKQLIGGRFGDAKINHLGDGHSVTQRDQDIGGLDIAVNEAFLVRVLNGVADLDEEIQPLACGKLLLIAIVGDLYAPHQFHHEIWPASVSRARIEHFGNVRMIHQRQGLALGFEAANDTASVHAELDNFEGDLSADRLLLLGHIDDSAAALADLLKELESANPVARFFGYRSRCTRGFFSGWISGQGQRGDAFGAEPIQCPAGYLGAALRTSSRWWHDGLNQPGPSPMLQECIRLYS